MVELPLDGVVVVELGDSASAPFAGQILAGLGATVWKIERPTGDSSRGWGPSMWKGDGASFHALNRGKHSLCLDIKQPDQLATLHMLIAEQADVFLHNLRPGSADQYGLDPDSLRVTKPELICCEVGAYGHIGPLNREPGYDPLMQAFAGIMNITGEEGRGPVRAGVSIVDFGTGMWATIGILAALYARKSKQIGATINSSLLETAIAWMSIGVASYNADGEPGSRHGSGIAFIAPHRAYETGDGYLILSAANDNLFKRLCEALGHPEWGTDERFVTNTKRIENRAELDRLIEERLKQQPRPYWQQVLTVAGLPNAPIQTTEELVQHEQTKALGIIGKPSDDEIGTVGLPLSFNGRRPSPLASAPGLGEHNHLLEEILKNGN